MLHREYPISIPGVSEPARLVAYVPEVFPEIDMARRRRSVLVCPGGGYHFCSEREAEPVALRLCAMGFNAFVLYYHTDPHAYPIPQLEAAAAMRLIREHAAELHTDPAHIAAMGFSAGGHLAASLGVLWNQPEIYGPLGATPESIRPDGLILSYPVITGGPHAHRGSFRCLLGARHDELCEALSLETRVAADTPPTFLWHTFDDDCVPVENTLFFASALRRAGVSAEVHIYPHGPHGLSLSDGEVYGPKLAGNAVPECAEWIALAARWLRAL